MQIVSQAMRILAKDVKNDKRQMLWAIIFMIYMATAFSFFVNSMFEEPKYVNPFADGMMLIFSPMLGFYFSRRSFKYISEDSYTQMLYYYRSIPVPTEAVIMSRALMGLGAFTVNGILFFSVIYAMGGELRSSLDLAGFIAFGLSWIGIGILINGIYIYFEFMRVGKSYLLFSFLITALISISIGILFLLGIRFSLFYFLIESSRQWKLLSPVMWGSLVLGLLGYILFCYLTLKRMRLRDLS